jgi:hypothetical protein
MEAEMSKNPDAARVPTSFSPGPQRVESGEMDASFVHRPVGFAIGDRLDFLSSSGRTSEPLMPLLWEGDQA